VEEGERNPDRLKGENIHGKEKSVRGIRRGTRKKEYSKGGKRLLKETAESRIKKPPGGMSVQKGCGGKRGALSRAYRWKTEDGTKRSLRENLKRRRGGYGVGGGGEGKLKNRGGSQKKQSRMSEGPV